MEMLRRMMIYGKVNTNGPSGWENNPKLPWYDEKKQYGTPIKGGINNGYSEAELNEFWTKIQGFCEYLFNKSHAACYSYITILTAWLKYYYPVEFFAAVLSIQTDEEKRKKYIEICEKEKIDVVVPDINASNVDFTPEPKKKKIYFGLSSIKGVGATVVGDIIANRPYKSLEDMYSKLPKKVLNKRVIVALAKSGALDSFNDERNRYAILNDLMTIRKEKNYEPLPEAAYNMGACINFEEETLSAPITYKPWWNTIKTNSLVKERALITSHREMTDKKGKLMAFATFSIRGCAVEAVIFGSVYGKVLSYFDLGINPEKTVTVSGKKDDKGKLIVKDITPASEPCCFPF